MMSEPCYPFKLEKLIWNAYNDIPFYKNGKLCFKTYDDFRLNLNFNFVFNSLPFTNKRIYKENEDAFISIHSRKDKLFVEYTSGSTGEPFKCYKSPNDRINIQYSLFKQRKRYLPDLKICDRFLRFYGSWTDINIEKNTLLLSIFYTNKKNLERYLEKIVEFKPRWIFGTPSSIQNFTQLLKNEGLLEYFLENVPIDYIETTGEILTDNVKNFINTAYSLNVVDHYGCREIWHIALRCKCGEFHIVEDNAFIEIINKDGNRLGLDEEGEIVITGLNNIDVPFIRYNIGDIGSISSKKCSCGNKAPIINMSGGRISDFIIFPDGRKINSVAIHHIFRKIGNMGEIGIEKYLVVQNDFFHLVFNLVVNSKYCRSCELVIKELAKSIFDKNITINFNYCNDIPVTNSGKHKTFISKIL